MVQRLQKYSILAGLFDYPDQKTDDLIRLTNDLLHANNPAATTTFLQFQQTILGMDLHSREEYFINTFEVEALISMDLGYILFGEDYKRGNFLAMMQQEQISAGNDLGSELADHLPNVMRLLPLMSEQEVAEELAYSIILPAIREILKKFENTDNVYQYAFETVLKVMETDFSGLPYETYQVKPDVQGCAGDEYACGADFLHEIGKQKF
jgi:nitrate reductase assembly molybdenum cofactor insertion protein NarJ